jgi:hypothetical protein
LKPPLIGISNTAVINIFTAVFKPPLIGISDTAVKNIFITVFETASDRNCGYSRFFKVHRGVSSGNRGELGKTAVDCGFT